MYLKQISLVGGIPFSVVLPKSTNSVNADLMSVSDIHQKLEKGYVDIEKVNVEDAANAFQTFRETPMKYLNWMLFRNDLELWILSRKRGWSCVECLFTESSI